ncbi:hypothetical protein V8V91_27095 [Algoriphagus halophilus]|uniref:hypothetical protein n=1 Tax=Algoriphagus halophilus TaxID=226505 RepID=UPI00358ED81A
MEVIQKLFIVDSTVISLFKDILKVAGRPRKDGRSKGGIKAHVMIHAAELMPCLVDLRQPPRSHLLKYLQLRFLSGHGQGVQTTINILVSLDGGPGIFFVSRMKNNAKFEN